MEKTKLEMDFLDGLNKIVRISMDDPKQDLINTDIEGAMGAIISHNIFLSKDGDLVGIGAARIVRTTVDDIKF